MLYIWIDSMRRANLPIPPSLAIAKTKSIASSLSIPETDFKASWQWLSRFKMRRGLQKMLLHGEGTEVNKSDPGLLATLNDLYAIIAQYDLENVYNMDETGLFFRLLPRYNLLMPDEDISTIRGKKNPKIKTRHPVHWVRLDVEFFCCWTMPLDTLRLLNTTILGSFSFPQIAQVGNSPAIWA
jgi:hypothetical protein